MGLGLLGVLAYLGLVLSGLAMEAADVVDPKDASSKPSSTPSTAITTTLSTAASSTWTTPSSVTQSSRTPQSVPPADYSHHYRTGARCRDGWHSDVTGSGACSWHGGVAEWLYADDRIVHDAKTGDELGTVKWVGAQAGFEVQRRAKYSLSLDETTAECDRVFTQWKRLTDMREPDRGQFVLSCQFRHW
jgi:hypothetical protein